ncbi:RNA polymerase sigma factor FliA [Paraferrimonas sp. SM1919]|uniref:RNA polymerase sigma factor FliA n=1 Tax=Paraferrimonas sp. SM1919 TaxID=2662263 RepID=UPI0013D8400C|nr:RNA polymerase sigma factor FliA [Paraferrimonas sp. SM1919]
MLATNHNNQPKNKSLSSSPFGGYEEQKLHPANQEDMINNEQYWLSRYLPLVKRTVNMMQSHCGPTLEKEDMEQLGLMALLESIRRYPGKHDPGFGSYAKQRVRGAILDELRRQDWRPRQLRQQSHELNDTIRQLSKELGRPPKDQEVAAALNLSEDDFRERLYASQAANLQSLETLLDDGLQLDGQDQALQREIQKRSLEQALKTLTKRQQVLLHLYYQQELSLKEIALVFQVTESRVCQLHKQAVSALQASLING